jgi:trk system potassium uptake protein TrkH
MGRFCAQILMVESVFMIPPLLLSIYDREPQAVFGFGISILIIAAVTALLFILCRSAKTAFFAREGMVCVGISWIAMIFMGALPFWLSGEIPHFIDAFFEITSGFTTTGCSILNDIESLSRGILFWRSFSHWLGGMGVLVFLLAIAPFSKGSGYTMHLMRAESPGPDFGKLVPKLKQTASILYLIYILLTILNLVFLLIGNMPFFDALLTAFSTAGTGGFAIKNDSMAGYSPYIQYVCTVFMILFGVNFSCFYMLLLRQFKSVFKYEELRLYIGIITAAIILVTINIRGICDTAEESFRDASFTVASIISSTGFCTADYDTWPAFSKGILLCISMVGACAGSTGGGLKCARLLILVKSLLRNIGKTLNPQRVQVVKINGRMIDEQTISSTSAFLSAYVIIIIASFMLISLDNYTMGTNFSAVLACVNNIGPGFDSVGPTCNFSGFSVFSKLVLCFDMLAGRLEIFPILILFVKGTWKHK